MILKIAPEDMRGSKEFFQESKFEFQPEFINSSARLWDMKQLLCWELPSMPFFSKSKMLNEPESEKNLFLLMIFENL